ncbi:MAG: prepilin-type N-terminal cleavage/methylation domain-containing protein [Alphaproteobacteria bacterium]|nr:prepilin-type N-terminal cleavage/methylation domain-containing protein [Alphaproteobacteria bacterium]
MHPNRKGFSLLELLLVVSVGTSLMMAGIAAYKNVMFNVQMAQIAQLMGTMQAQIDWSYGSRNYYPNGNMLDDLVAQRVFPATIPTVGSGDSMYARLPLGIYQITGHVQTYDVTIDAINGAACIKIAEIVTPANNTKLTQMSVNDTVYKAKNSNDYNGLRQKLLTNCRQTDANKIVWTFR